MTTTMNHNELLVLLEKHGQESVLRFWDQLEQAQREHLAEEISNIDFEQLSVLVADEDAKPNFAAMAAAATSPPAVRADGSGASWTVEQATERGEKALRNGEVAVVIVAGGQGTRLGFDKPKGMFKIGPVSGRTLFQIFADRIVASEHRYGTQIPLYVMTSEATDAETKEYFENHKYLGLDPSRVRIFKQGTMPAVDSDSGQLLLASKGSLALSPDGHGGTVRALDRNGCLDDAVSRGVKYLGYIQVDNPLANLCDPTMVGHHLLANSEMTTQVIRKRYPMEKVGNLVVVDGKAQIIEYSDLDEAFAIGTDENGDLKLWAGSIGVHVINVDFLRRIAGSVDALPFHRASKKVPFIDATGKSVQPSEPNATKFERFIFDLLPQAQNAFVVESLPSDSFAPVKNAEGAETDTASLAKSAISDLHRCWLEKAGAVVKRGVQVEINPRWALSPDQVAEKIGSELKIDSDRYFDT